MNYEINGGVNSFNGDIERLEAHGGVLYVKGKVGTLIHHGGVMYDQRPANRVEYRTERLSDEERQKYKRKIADLERKLNQCVGECLQLREKLSKQATETPPDDVLIAKIEHLRRELAKERDDRRREVDELNERIDAALEINARLRSNHNEDNPTPRSQHIADEHIDILATIINLYPYTPDKDIEFEFGIPVDKIRYISSILGAIKSTEQREDARDYLRRQKMELVDRRGGIQGTTFKIIEKVAKNGRVVARYYGAAEAARAEGVSDKTISHYCQFYYHDRRYNEKGYTYRYKKEDNDKTKETTKD